ncbi:MAG: hypothetical protein R2824_09450 [Saprospiraceae bacterium]
MAKKKKKAKGSPTFKEQVAAASQSSAKKDINQLDTPSFRVFTGLVVLIVMVGLLAGNDYTSIWSGAEAAQLWQALSDAPSSWLGRFLHAVYDDGPLNVFYLRFFGIFFFLICLVPVFFIGKRLFGKNTIWLALLLLVVSLLVPNIAKRATIDIYLFGSQLLFGMNCLLLLKSPHWAWRALWLVSWWTAFVFDPLGSLLFAVPFLVVLWRSHPEAGILRDWRLLVPALAGLGLIALLQPNHWLDQGIALAWLRSGYGKYLFWQLIAILPFIGFVSGGIRDLFYKVKRGEEFSILLTAWILAALLSQSITLSWALALLAAKHMQLYFNPKYPFYSWVRGPAILHLIAVFFILAMSMVYSFFTFLGLGFRSLLMVSGLYWGMSLLGVIGLYGYNHRLLIGGPILAGALVTALFWYQAGPLLESKRDWNEAIVEMAREKQSDNRPEPLLLYHPANSAFPAMAVYGLDKMDHVRLLSSEAGLKTAIEQKEGIAVLPVILSEQLNIPATTDTLSGWSDQLETIKLQIVSSQ